MPLTRFLFMADEVILTFIENLLNQRDLKECYFWLTEYYYSGFRKNTWQLLWKIFYDFYAIQYPKLEGYIHKEYQVWQKKREIISLLNIISLFFQRNASSDVFLARHALPRRKKTSGRPPKWLKDFPPHLKAILLSIHHQDVNGIAYHIEEINAPDLHNLICAYFTKVRHIKIGKGALSTYMNKKHILWALILHLYRHESNIIIDDQFLPAVVPEHIAWVKEINDKNIHPLYKTLSKKRLYSISDTIGCFNLKRFDKRCPNMKQLLGFHWEYFASYSSLWRKRFRFHHAKRDKTKFEMRFKTDDNLEAFGEKYNYEPDEQSNETQNKSILEIKKRPPRDWVKDIFHIEYYRKNLFPIYM